MQIYIRVFILLSTLFYTGFLILKGVSAERRIQVILPAGSIFGICLHIFLINLLAHFIQGVPGFFFAIFLQSILAFFITKNAQSDPLIFPAGREKRVFLFFLFLWIIFVYQITAHATTNGADSVLHQSFASRFIKGDYPMHQPWQPDYIAYYHFGGAQLLGSFHALTGAPYYFIHPFIAFWFLLFISQILTYIIKYSEKITWKQILISSLPTFIGLISVGGFFIAWPIKFELPIFSDQIPVLSNAFEVYGSPTNLDALIFFLHRFLTTSFIISLLVLLIHPKKESKLIFFVLTIFLSTLALTDESVFIVTLLPILITSFFTIFNKSIKKTAILFMIVSLLTLFQGGLITEAVLNRYQEASNVLIFPGNAKAVTEKYMDYRLAQQKSKFYPTSDHIKTFNWFHPGIIWQLSLCLIFIIFLSKRGGSSSIKILCYFLFFSATLSLISFHSIVPKGYTHPNGNRFLALSYFLSGICLATICCWWFSRKSNLNKTIRYIINTLIIWLLLISIVPPLINLFPRKIDNWFIIKKQNQDSLLQWIEKNISRDERIVALTNILPSNDLNINIVVETGVLTPVWAPKPRVHDSFDISPSYTDLHYTLNPEIITDLKLNYLLISNSYISQLPKERQIDLQNRNFFIPVLTSDDQQTTILKILPRFLSDGKNYKGTFKELNQIAPQSGAYCMDYPPNISENIYRIIRLVLYDRRHYCNKGGAFYNGRIDVMLDFPRDNPKQYEYLILGKNVDPYTVCSCRAKLLWEGLGNGLKFWKTQE